MAEQTTADEEVAYRARFATRPSTAVIEALATLKEVDPTEVRPIYDTLDLDALDTLFRSPAGMRSPGQVRFPIDGYTFLVTSDGWIAAFDTYEPAATLSPFPRGENADAEGADD